MAVENISNSVLERYRVQWNDAIYGDYQPTNDFFLNMMMDRTVTTDAKNGSVWTDQLMGVGIGKVITAVGQVLTLNAGKGMFDIQVGDKLIVKHGLSKITELVVTVYTPDENPDNAFKIATVTVTGTTSADMANSKFSVSKQDVTSKEAVSKTLWNREDFNIPMKTYQKTATVYGRRLAEMGQSLDSPKTTIAISRDLQNLRAQIVQDVQVDIQQFLVNMYTQFDMPSTVELVPAGATPTADEIIKLLTDMVTTAEDLRTLNLDRAMVLAPSTWGTILAQSNLLKYVDQPLEGATIAGKVKYITILGRSIVFEATSFLRDTQRAFLVDTQYWELLVNAGRDYILLMNNDTGGDYIEIRMLLDCAPKLEGVGYSIQGKFVETLAVANARAKAKPPIETNTAK